VKVAYIFTTNLSHKILSTMVVPQLEENRHGVDVVGMFFFGDNAFLLQKDNELAERLKNLSKEKNIMLMACDQCAYERNIQNSLVDNASIGCFPDLYAALAKSGFDQAITL